MLDVVSMNMPLTSRNSMIISMMTTGLLLTASIHPRKLLRNPPQGEQPCQPPGLKGQPLTLPGGQQSLVFWPPQRKCCRVEDGYVEERGLICLRNAADQLLGTGHRCG